MGPLTGGVALGGSRPLVARRSWRRLELLLVTLALFVAATGYIGYVAVEGSRQLVLPSDVSTNCTTPAQLGWTYEAINYDQADDARLASENDGHMATCAEQGIAGTAVVSADGIRLAGWYIPAASAPDPAAPTVLIVHGHSDNKSAMLPYAEAIHDRYNVVVMDLRHSGRSTGTQHTLGVLEQYDVRAMLDWLDRTKGAEHVALLALSGGAASGLAMSRTDDRIDAFITDSLHARSELFIARGLQEAGHPAYPGTWATLLGFWARTGHDIRSADPIDSLPAISDRPLLMLHGTADATDVPAESAGLLYAEAQRLGMDVELRYCDGAVHAGVIDTCKANYGRWIADFLSRSFGTTPDAG